MSELRPSPRSQRQIITQASQNKEVKEPVYSRANDIRRDDDTVKDFASGLIDIDSAIKYYFDNVVQPEVMENGTKVIVPSMYGSSEKWKAVESDGYLRDKNSKIQAPLIVYKRTAIAKLRELTNKVDGNFPQVYVNQPIRWSPKNKYDQFSRLTGQKPVVEYVNVIAPDYVNLTYDVIVWTNYLEQMNKIIESVIYTEGSYWGEVNRFSFRATINDYTNTTDVLDTDDRVVRTTFQISLLGHIVTDSLAKAVSEKLSGKTVSVRKVQTDNNTE